MDTLLVCFTLQREMWKSQPHGVWTFSEPLPHTFLEYHKMSEKVNFSSLYVDFIAVIFGACTYFS